MTYYYSPFRKMYSEKKREGEEACPFCSQKDRQRQSVKNAKGVVVENAHYFWMVNFFPKFEGHTMVVPKRHVKALDEERSEEIIARQELILFALSQLKKIYPDCGFEIFIQYGPGSAQSVEHLHWHIVPARKDDPLRSFEKMGHFYTDEEGKEKTVIFPIEIKLAKEDLIARLTEVVGNESVCK